MGSGAENLELHQQMLNGCVPLPFVIPRACDFIDLSREGRDFSKIVIPRAHGFTDLSCETLDFKQTRHPERSASPIYPSIRALVARSRRTSAVLILPMLLGAFRPPKPENRIGRGYVLDHAYLVSGTRIIFHPRVCSRRTKTVLTGKPVRSSALRWLKSSKQHGQDKHRRDPSTPRHKCPVEG
jgi:hypothetical protein